MKKIVQTKEYKIDNTGLKNVTKDLQNLIDESARNSQTLVINKGKYLVSCLFIPSFSKIIFKRGAKIYGIADKNLYPIIPTRVAGIEMDWYPAIINIINAKEVEISGKGTIIGQGPMFSKLYWEMRKKYDKEDRRFACDYDVKRVRNILVSQSNNISIKDLKSLDSGFWNTHILYSKNIILDNLTISNPDKNGASTDGIDIDSCSFVTISNCNITSNDDSICFKSGRDQNGRKIGISTRNIKVKHCKINQGFGITIGSEVSGGIKNISISDINFKGTDCGFRIKTTSSRGGYISNIKLNNISMEDVNYAIRFDTNWNPLYNQCSFKDTFPSYYKLLIPEENVKLTDISNIYLNNICINKSKTNKSFVRLFHISGFKENPIKNMTIKNIKADVDEYGIVKNVSSFNLYPKEIKFKIIQNKNHDEYDNR